MSNPRPDPRTEPLTLYYTPASFYSQRALLAIVDKGVPFWKHVISISAGDNLQPWYMRIQPKGTVPSLTHGQVVKTESTDIIMYLDEITPDSPKYLPDSTTPEGERVAYFQELMQPLDMWLITFGSSRYRHHTQDCQLPIGQNPRKMKEERLVRIHQMADKHPELRQLYVDKMKASEEKKLDEDKLIAALNECDTILAEIETELAKRWQHYQGNFNDEDPWLCCKHFTIADIYLATLLNRLFLIGQSKRFWADGKRPYIEAYFARVQIRDSFKAVCEVANKIMRGEPGDAPQIKN